MKFRFFPAFFLLSLLFSTSASSNDKAIKIIVISGTVPKNSNVHITGTTEDLGAWNSMLKMEKVTHRKFKFETSAAVGETLQFKFNRGNWRTEAVDSNGIEFPQFVIVVKKDTTLIFNIPKWRDQVFQKTIISTERLINKGGFFELFEGWKYKIGDDTSWADPSYNDREWKPIHNTLLKRKEFNEYKWKWTGNIWYRNNIFVDSAVLNKPFGLNFFNSGAAEIYLDGKLIYEFGQVGNSPETEKAYFSRTPKHIIFKDKTDHVLAVRLSDFSAAEKTPFEIPVGFNMLLSNLDEMISNREEQIRINSIQQMVFCSFLFAFAIMHFLLFAFYPKSKENLYYAISMLSFSIVVYSGNQTVFANSISEILDVVGMNSVCIQTALLFGLLTVYASSYPKIPKHSIIFIVISALFIIQTIFFSPLFDGKYIDYAFYFYALVVTIEILRSMIRSIKKKEAWGWGWIIGAGFIVAMLFITYQILIMTEVVRPLFGINLVYVYGIVFLAITVSINLSKKISDTNKNLSKQLIQIKELNEIAIEQERKASDEEIKRKLLEADNLRKTKELEEARKLQFSMLPREVPPVPYLDIAVYMKPATEIGGDYYDFKYDNNGSLTIAVGDATGHGMRAGTMVATIKGLFSAEPINNDIIPFFERCNTIIRDMQLGNLYMAMMMAKIKNHKLTISSAGMPPVLIYRERTKQVDEIRIPGIPLGGYPLAHEDKYSQKETTISNGDTILFMSDGFPELFNKHKEILDYDKAKEIFCGVARKNPKEIISELNGAAEKWMEGINQQDDITFVVVKVK